MASLIDTYFCGRSEYFVFTESELEKIKRFLDERNPYDRAWKEDELALLYMLFFKDFAKLCGYDSILAMQRERMHFTEDCWRDIAWSYKKDEKLSRNMWKRISIMANSHLR